MRKMTRTELYVRAVVVSLVGLLSPSGCALSQFRQQAVECSLNETARARDEIVGWSGMDEELPEFDRNTSCLS